MTSARSLSKRQTAASSGSRRPTNRSGKEVASKMSLRGRSTCVSASALSLDAQPAHVERVVRRISRPVLGIGIFFINYASLNYGVVVVVVGVSAEPGNGKMN